MKAFKIVLLAICLTLIVGSTLAAKDKGKKDEVKVVFLLDDSKLVVEQTESYGLSLQKEALESLVLSATYLGKNDFASIAEAYEMATNDIAWSEECALQALDLRKDVVAAKAEAEATGATNAGGDPAIVSANLKAQIDKLKSGEIKLSTAQKGYFLVSLTRIAAALAKETILVTNAKAYVENVKGMSVLAKAKEAKNLPKATGMVSTLPGAITTQLGTLATYITIAKTNGIEIPKEVKLP